ncbi:MFS transporter [Clostridium saccharoperbutylacetonicum]
MELESNTTIKENENSSKMGFGEKVSYGFGNLGANLLLTTANTFISFFYTEIAGISIAVVGMILLLGRVFDGVADLGMGVLVDKTNNKHGKARPWLLWLAIPYGIAIVLLFTSPDLGTNGKIIYAFITYIFSMFVFTGINVPYNTLSALSTQDQYERSQLSVFRTAFGFFGALGLSVITMPLVKTFGDGKQGWIITAIIFGVVATLLYLVCFKNVKERAVISEEKAKVPLKESIGTLLKNKYWILVITVNLIGTISAGLGGVNVYYAQYILGNSSYIGMIGIASFLPIVACVLFVTPLLKKFGKKNLAVAGAVLGIVGALIMAIAPTNITIIMAGTIIKGLGAGPLMIATFAMLADTVEYGQWKTGVRAEGLTFSAQSFSEKVGTGLGGVVLGAILSIGGYIGGQAVQSDVAITSIKFAFVYAPIVASALQVILLYFYNLDKEYPRILAELKERNENA